MRDEIKRLPWNIIIILALVQFIRPVLSIAGAFDNFKAGPLIVTAVVTVVWIAVAVAAKVREPVKVLAAAGVVYAIISMLTAVFLQLFFTQSAEDAAPVPLLLTVGLVAAAIYNAAWGALLGLVAMAIRRILDRRPPKRNR